jgi:hypothetical protein
MPGPIVRPTVGPMVDQTQDTVQEVLTKIGLGRLPVDPAEAERHLAELRTLHPAQPAEARVPSAPGPRRVGRRLAREWERASIARERIRHAWDAPHNRVGWKVAHLKLLRRPTLSPPTLAVLAAFAVVVLWRYLPFSFHESTAATAIAGFLFATLLGSAVAATWGELFRCPYYSWRIRRRLAKAPWCVLPTTSGKLRAELMGRDESRLKVPRRELYDDLLPGILDRSRRDVQIIVGGPGTGKTTALVDISELLARMGIVPVVVPLWGQMPESLVDEAKKRFVQHSGSLLHSEARLGEVWEWLRAHRRVVVLVDDLDRIAPDGERGFMLRCALNDLAGAGLPAVVTTRPAGIPAGLAASAINLEDLDEEAAVEHVLRVAREQPGTIAKELTGLQVTGNVALWIREGKFAEVPFYLELLARLVAARRCEELAPASALVRDRDKFGRVRLREDGRCEWNPLWVRFRLLERFYDEIADGHVHQWLAIDTRERRSCLASLSETALATLAAKALRALPEQEWRDGQEWRDESESDAPLRVKIEDFLNPDDRSEIDEGERTTVSVHEVIDTAERLRMLDRDPKGELHFSHRILQAYLAGRCLAKQLREQPVDATWPKGKRLDWLGALLDPRHPERMTAHMTLIFAALRATVENEFADHDGDGAPGLAAEIDLLMSRLVNEAMRKVTPPSSSQLESKAKRRLDPRRAFDAEGHRVDPDDALAMLTTAAEIARATGELERAPEILENVKKAPGATRWTKLNAISAVATLTDAAKRAPEDPVKEQWTRIWEFARDPDDAVRRAASEAMADDAFSAYDALEPAIDGLLSRAAIKSAHDLPLDAPCSDRKNGHLHLDGGPSRSALDAYGIKGEATETLSLRALGWILPAIVSGLREHPVRLLESGAGSAQRRNRAAGDARGDKISEDDYADLVNRARQALERLVVLAFQRRFPELEASVAQGFKSDAMRHAGDFERSGGPGFVASNRQLVSDICLDNAHYWYARMVLHQALGLYTIAGSSPQVALDTYARLLQHGGEPHPFVWRAARQARRAVLRYLIGSSRWSAFIWADEGDAVSRRQAAMNPIAAQLVGDVTLLLNLRESASDDRQTQSARVSQLPYCLSRSKERLEILGAGCSKRCGYGLCPLAEAPVDEPDGKRTISRAFCRGQQRLAARGVPPWQQGIRRKALKEFWFEMEQRART